LKGAPILRLKGQAHVPRLPSPIVFASGPAFAPFPRGFGGAFSFLDDSSFLISAAIPRRLVGVLALLCEVWLFMQIMVRDNNVDQALRALKKKLQREGVYREMKLRRHYEKPSEKRAREKAAAVRRARKMERKRMERDGIK
jgi:small subunit ribosomal protein S21